MRRLLPLLLLPVLAVAPLAACSASPTKPRAEVSASPEPSSPVDDTGGGDDTGPDCAPVDGNSPAGQLTTDAVFPGGTDAKATYEHHTFVAARCKSDPNLPGDLDAGCAQPFPFVSAGEAPFAHALLGITGAQEMTEADLSATTGGQPVALREIIVSYADAKSAAASVPAGFAKACGTADSGAYRLTGQDPNGAAITSMVEVAGAKVLVVEFDGAGWADTDYVRVLNLATTAAG